MKLRTAGHHLNHSATGTRPSSCPPHARLARPPPDGFFSPSSDGGGDLGLRRRRRRKRATTSWTATAVSQPVGLMAGSMRSASGIAP